MYLVKATKSPSRSLSEVPHSKRDIISTRPSGSSGPTAPLNYSRFRAGEMFGMEYTKPGCRPVPLDWEKHRTQKSEESPASVPPTPVHTPAPDAASSSSWAPPSGMASPGPAPSPGPSEDNQEPPAAIGISYALPVGSLQRIARTGPIKRGGLVFVLDHTLDTSHERCHRQLATEAPW